MRSPRLSLRSRRFIPLLYCIYYLFQWFSSDDDTPNKPNVNKYLHEIGAKTVKTTTNAPTTTTELVTNSDGSPVETTPTGLFHCLRFNFVLVGCGSSYFMCDIH